METISKIKKPKPAAKQEIDYSKFKSDLTANEIQSLLKFNKGIISPFVPIERLSCSKTVGLGATFIEIDGSVGVLCDPFIPQAAFDYTNLVFDEDHNTKPAISVFFEPKAYGITETASYVMEFLIEVPDRSTFMIDGVGGTVRNTGTKVLQGSLKVSIIFNNVPFNDRILGNITETSGGKWKWLSTKVSFPPIIVNRI